MRTIRWHLIDVSWLLDVICRLGEGMAIDGFCVWLCKLPLRVCGSFYEDFVFMETPVKGMQVLLITHLHWLPQELHQSLYSMRAHPKHHLSGWIWGGFKILNSCCIFSHFFGSIVNTTKGGDINMRHLCEGYQMWLLVPSFSEVVGHQLGLAYIFKIGDKAWNSNLTIIPNHKPLKGSLFS